MKNLMKYPIVVLFALFIGITSFLDLNTVERKHSELENRPLATKPTMTLKSVIENKYTADYEKYTNDQFIIRDKWITLKSISETVLGKIENNGIVFGKDNYMFDKLNTPDYQRIDKNINYYKEFLEKYPELNITVALIPNSYSVLSEKVPMGLNNINQQEYINKVFSALSGNNLKTLDFTKALKDHENEYIYYKTDHHWTTLGAYYAYSEYIKTQGMEPIGLSELEENTVENFLGTYFNKAKLFNAESDTITWYDIPVKDVEINLQKADGIYDLPKFDTRDKYAAFLRGNNGISVIKSDVNKYKQQDKTTKILVIKDSYANSFVPFLLYNYDEVHVIDLRYFVSKMSLYLSEHQFEDILLMYNFKNFSEDINIPKLRY